MRQRFLRWLIPLVILFALVTLVCGIYAGNLKMEATDHELHRLSNEIKSGLYDADLVIKTVIDYNDMAEVACSNISYIKDKETCLSLLKEIAEEDDVKTAVICDIDGNGYNDKGKNVSLRTEPFFEEVQRNFSKGGKGQVLIGKSDMFNEKCVAIVNRLTFSDNVKGYLISVISVEDLADKVFVRPMMTHKAALISLGGQVIAVPNYLSEFGGNFWDDVSANVSIESIKLSISQKNDYISEIKDFGYVLAIPSKVTSGAVVILLDYGEISGVIRREMVNANWFVVALYGSIIAFAVIMYISHFLTNAIRKEIDKRIATDSYTDDLTGLYNEEGVLHEVNNYISISDNQKGMIVRLYVDEFLRLRREKGEAAAEEKINIFSRRLALNYRSTDIIGRLSDESYIVFMKDIAEEKDIRKQVDELQMFLYDMKTDGIGDGLKLNISVGAALLPRDGVTAEEIKDAAGKALEISKLEGRGRISFYK